MCVRLASVCVCVFSGRVVLCVRVCLLKDPDALGVFQTYSQIECLLLGPCPKGLFGRSVSGHRDGLEDTSEDLF